MATIILVVVGGRALIHFKNHSTECAHSHCTINERPTIVDTAVEIPKLPPRVPEAGQFVPTIVHDKNFSFDSSLCHTCKSKKFQPGLRYTFEMKKAGNVNGIQTFYCTMNKMTHCAAKAFEKKVNGKLECCFQHDHNHNEPVEEPKVLVVDSNIKTSKGLKQHDFTLQFERVPKMRPKTQKRQNIQYVIIMFHVEDTNTIAEIMNLEKPRMRFPHQIPQLQFQGYTYITKCKAKLATRTNKETGEERAAEYGAAHTCLKNIQVEKQEKDESMETEDDIQTPRYRVVRGKKHRGYRCVHGHSSTTIHMSGLCIWGIRESCDNGTVSMADF